MRSDRLIAISILLSVASVIGTFGVNHELAVKHLNAHGKTRALFGLIELSYVNKKFYLLLPAMFSLTLELIVVKWEGFKNRDFAVLTLIALAASLVFFPLWRLMI